MRMPNPNWIPQVVCLAIALGCASAFGAGRSAAWGEEIQWFLRSQHEVAAQSGRFHRTQLAASWPAARTAVIVCDMWDRHPSFVASQRMEELGPRMNAWINVARQRGVTIIHAPSECMSSYRDHPSRQRATAAPKQEEYPTGVDQWCESIPGEAADSFPIEQSVGTEEENPAQQAAWEENLRREQRDPRRPWKQQLATIEIDPDQDWLTDSGTEIWNILGSRQLDHVIVAGVHSNLGLLGRPFGVRRMKLAGKQVAVLRDLTDTLYDPRSWPYVSHFSATDLVTDYIERYLAPTISSDQLLGGDPFRFATDKRPHLALVINESEYETERTVPLFARERLQRDYRLSYLFGDSTDGNRMPGVELIAEADLLVLSVRRRTLPEEQLQVFRDFAASKKGIVGIRTANHAFSLRDQDPPAGLQAWPQLDREVFGGNYTNHYGPELIARISLADRNRQHPILLGIDQGDWYCGGSLYRVSPLDSAATILMQGAIPGFPAEPVAWTFQRAGGGKSFYTSLGVPSDFDHPIFQQLLSAAIAWGARQDR